MTIIRYIIITLYCLFTLTLAGQTKAELEQKRKKIINEIEKTNKFLKTAQKEKDSAVKDISAINTQVKNRKRLIKTVQEEVAASELALEANKRMKDSINQQYELLIEQYASILRYAYLQELSNHKISFLLSSESLNTFLLRYQYIKQFDGFQKQKQKEIERLRIEILQADESIQQEQAEKLALLEIETQQYNQLSSEKKTKESLLKSIAQKESKLKKELQKRQKERQKLNDEIEAIIVAQFKAAKEKSTTKSEGIDVALSSNFGSNRGKLPWPVSNGFISTRFGTHPHPTLKGIKVKSNGVDISCTGSLTVKTVFDGKVVGIIKVVGSQNMVIINHGQYHSVYSNLTDVVVRKDMEVKRGQVIGSLSNGKDGRGELHFELWDGKQKLDPEQWIR